MVWAVGLASVGSVLAVGGSAEPALVDCRHSPSVGRTAGMRGSSIGTKHPSRS